MIAALMLATSLASTPAMAQPHGHDQGPPPRHELAPPPPPDAQWDRRGPPPGWQDQQWEYRQRYLRRHHHRDDDHDATVGLIAGVILGFALGAAVADSQERQSYAQSHMDDQAWMESCRRRYRSFDPDTGTYLGYDGLRHYCR